MKLMSLSEQNLENQNIEVEKFLKQIIKAEEFVTR